MTDTIRCSVKSHAMGARRFQWDQIATGDWEAHAYCLQHMGEIDLGVINPDQFAAALPPKPPVAKTLI